ncbi:MAG: hypothetical protein ACK4YO_03995, partial [Candidatus Altarchaeaceae archaeon]
NASTYSWKDIVFKFSDLLCNSTTCDSNIIQASNIACDKDMVLYPNVENITCTLSVPENTLPGNYSGTLNISRVWNSSCPVEEKWNNIRISVMVINASISVPPGPEINYGNVTRGMIDRWANLTIPNTNNYSVIIDSCKFTNLTTVNNSVILDTNLHCNILGGNIIPANTNKTINIVLNVPENIGLGNYSGMYSIKLIFNDPSVPWNWRGEM